MQQTQECNVAHRRHDSARNSRGILGIVFALTLSLLGRWFRTRTGCMTRRGALRSVPGSGDAWGTSILIVYTPAMIVSNIFAFVCSCSAIMSPPNCSGKVSPPKLGGGLESKAVTKNSGDRECGRRASECEGGGRSVGAQRATGEAAQAGLRPLRPEVGAAWQPGPGAGEPDAGATAPARGRVGARRVCGVQRHASVREAGAGGSDRGQPLDGAAHFTPSRAGFAAEAPAREIPLAPFAPGAGGDVVADRWLLPRLAGRTGTRAHPVGRGRGRHR